MTSDTSYFKTRAAGIAHLMVDLETMGVGTSSPILTIGAVVFNPYTVNTFEQLHDRSFYTPIDIEDSIKWCPHLEGGTLKWWLSQKIEALKALTAGDSLTLKNGLLALSNYATDRSAYSPMPALYRPMTPPARIIWAKGPDFDCKIIENAFKALDMPYPFHYSNHRCVRTITDAAFPDPETRPERIGEAHDARDDAVNQAIVVQLSYQQLGLHTTTEQL